MQSSTRLTLAALLSLALAPCLGTAQADKPAKPEPEAQPAQSEPKAPKPQPQPYLLTLSVKESNSGKTTLEKSYTLTVIADDTRYHFQNLRDGDRIPYQGDKGQTYEDVGTNIDASEATRRGETLAVSLRAESSSLVATPNFNPGNLPQISRWNISVVAVLLPGKPTIVYSATDAISGHKVEIQATAQPLNAQ
ncbi:MAG: hypothetical protein ABSG62_06535 [Terracidiphilus sp.]|jgi:hypothetical protein